MLARYVLALIFCVLGLSVKAQESSDYVALVLGTVHFTEADLNDVNPGLTYGRRWRAEGSNLEYHLEGGVVYNSYEEISPLIAGGVSNRLFDIGSVEVRGALSFGTAYYGELAPTLKRKYDIPNIDGFIPIVFAGVTLRHESAEYRFTLVPGEELVSGVNFSVAFAF